MVAKTLCSETNKYIFWKGITIHFCAHSSIPPVYTFDIIIPYVTSCQLPSKSIEASPKAREKLSLQHIKHGIPLTGKRKPISMWWQSLFHQYIFIEVQLICTQSLQSCPTLCDPMDYSPPGSSVYGIFQARILEQYLFLQGTFPTHKSNTCLLYLLFRRQVLYPVSHLGRQQLIYNVLISSVQQSDPLIHIQIHLYIFNILFHYGLSQDTEYSSLCYTVRPCLSILYIQVYIC